MKKISLSIPEPCHENWDGMSKTGKGRFCAACQKTVIDFGRMSDREVAEFFKKPASSVCGRFQQDQLDRDILVPRKRIPWVKYFFQIGLPAFLFSTKASAQGQVVIKKDTVTKTVGPVKRTTPKKKGDQKLKSERERMEFKEPILSGASTGTKEIIDLQGAAARALVIEPWLEGPIAGYVVCRREKPLRIERIKEKITRVLDTAFTNFSVYPNPVRNNSSLRISCKRFVPGPYTLSVINIQGEVVQTSEVAVENKSHVFDYTLKSTTAGTYFIRLNNRQTGKSYTEKIVVQ